MAKVAVHVGLAFIGITFCVIILILALKQPLWLAVFCGIVTMAILFQMEPLVWLDCVRLVVTTESSISVLIAFYLIVYLQRMMEARDLLKAASRDMDDLLRNRRASAVGSCAFIGLLPSPVAVLICGELMRETCDDALPPDDQAVVTNWLRHVPESFMPTYPTVLLMASLSGVAISDFMVIMLVPALMLVIIGYIPTMRKIPSEPKQPPSCGRAKALAHVFQHLWPILLILVLILTLHLSMVFATLIAIAMCILIYRFKPKDLLVFVKTAFEPNLLGTIFMTLVLKEFITASGVVETLPELLSTLPLPSFLVFFLLFFVGNLIAGGTGIVAMGAPLAFAGAASGDVCLMVLLMCASHAASQLQPTHVCLVAISEFYGVSLGRLILKTIPRALVFCAFAIVYYMGLTAIGF